MSNHLAPITVETVIQLSESRSETAAWKELLSQALTLLGERDRELKRLRENYHSLLDERRREREQSNPKAAA